jgi:UDP-2,4-diacetamido-2,4,6-trideoxy-beta-L-altropyranose hydrolase
MAEALEKIRILVWADGGREVGMGHWSRCLFLLSCIDEPYEKHFFVSDTLGFSSLNDQEKIIVHRIDEERDFLEQVCDKDLVILDGYHYTADLFIFLQHKGAFVMYIDDLLRKDIQADIIINHSIGIAPSDYGSSTLSTYLLGAPYSLISGIFAPVEQDNQGRLNNLFICMGGADPVDFTLKFLKEHSSILSSFSSVHVLVGALYQKLAGLKEFCDAYPHVQVHQGLPKSEVSVLMQQCGTAVLSASTMAMEYAQVGGILYILETADNQKHLFRGLLSSGLALELEEVCCVTNAEQRASLYSELSEKQQSVYDGLSAKRFKKLFKELTCHVQLRLRRATAQDIGVTYRWASDKGIRAFSFSQDPITLESHSGWFHQKVDSSNCLYLIAEFGEEAIGSIRFDIQGEQAIISYLIDRKWHGYGMGRVLLQKGIRFLQKNFGAVKIVAGNVMPRNISSMKTFERLAFNTEIKADEKQGIKIRYWKQIKA